MGTNVQSQGAAAVSLDDRTLPGPWQAFTGGRISAPDNKVFPGHMLAAETLGGTPSVENIITRAVYKLEVWHDLSDWVGSRVGVGDGTLTRLFLGRDGKVFGRGKTRIALLIGCEISDYDATGEDATTIELEWSVKGP